MAHKVQKNDVCEKQMDPCARPKEKCSMKYYGKIDGLRFVAILFVLIEHFADKVGHLISAGYYGVDLFFVISGFLITNILLKSKKSFFTSYKNFVGRRTLRIFPIYYLMLGSMLVLGYQACWDSIFYLATYTYNYAWIHEGIQVSWLSHFWSLAIEEQFYLFWPIFILATRTRPRFQFVATAMLTATCFFQLTTGYFTCVNDYNFVGLFPRAGSLCMGALGAMLFHHDKLGDALLGKNILLEWLVMGSLAVSLVTTYQMKYVVLSLCSLYLILKSVHSDFHIGFINRFLENRKIQYIGTISYGIYIIHPPLGNWITTNVISPWWYRIDFDALGIFSFTRHCLWVAILPTYMLLCIGVATISSRYIEKPILSLKDRLFK